MEKTKVIQTILDEEKRTKLDFYGNVPCPIKPKFREAYDKMAKTYYEETGKQFFSYVPLSCQTDFTQEVKSLSNILSAKSIDEMPDIAISMGIDDYCHSRIIEQYISKGYYDKVIDTSKCKFLKGVDLSDKYNATNVISFFPIVLLIDKRKMGDLPIPKKWSDLLDPIYKDSICIPGGHGEVSTLFPLYIYKDYGEEGLKKLEYNTATIAHGSKAAQIAGTLNSEGAPIYIISWFFAKACVNTKYTEIVWPEDGALIDPMLMYIKKNLDEGLERIKDFLISEEVSHIFADNNLPSTSTLVENKLPENATFKWLGWDYIYENKIEELMKYVVKDFQKYIK